MAAVVSKWTGVPVEKAAAWCCMSCIAVAAHRLGVLFSSQRPHVTTCYLVALILKVSSDEGARLVKLEEARPRKRLALGKSQRARAASCHQMALVWNRFSTLA